MSLSRYKTDCLFLPVGTNPLPNYVSSLLLVNEGGKVILLHSRGTGVFAKNIEKAIRDKKVPVAIEMWEIDEADGVRIIQKLKKEILPSLNAPSSVGLNYTGGTKSMAVHAYRALENYAYEKEIPAVFSYLDARTLSIIFILSDGSLSKREPVREKVKISVEELLALHGYSQMGGDEARVGLVCCSDDPLLVQREVEEDWFAEGRVRVFGRKDLVDLPEKLRNWFEST